jgi:hypothetical protein
MTVSRSWNHEVHRLDPELIDRYDRFGTTCATGKCQATPTHLTRWNYLTGRGGRASGSTRHVCTAHGEAFARKHDLTIGDARPDRSRPTPGATVTIAATAEVRVHRARAGQWYLQQRRPGADLPATSNRWLSGILPTASLEEAIAEAETLLARDRLAPAADWCRDGAEATADLIDAHRHRRWAERTWRLRIACNSAGMWQLSRSLDDRFGAIVDDLGDHNMSLTRAVHTATALLAAGQWTLRGDRWSIDGDSATHEAWHRDQVTPAPPPRSGQAFGTPPGDGARPAGRDIAEAPSPHHTVGQGITTLGPLRPARRAGGRS